MHTNLVACSRTDGGCPTDDCADDRPSGSDCGSARAHHRPDGGSGGCANSRRQARTVQRGAVAVVHPADQHQTRPARLT